MKLYLRHCMHCNSHNKHQINKLLFHTPPYMYSPRNIHTPKQPKTNSSISPVSFKPNTYTSTHSTTHQHHSKISFQQVSKTAHLLHRRNLFVLISLYVHIPLSQLWCVIARWTRGRINFCILNTMGWLPWEKKTLNVNQSTNSFESTNLPKSTNSCKSSTLSTLTSPILKSFTPFKQASWCTRDAA